MASNDLTTNLLVTSLLSQLASYPQPLLRSVLIHPDVVLQVQSTLSTTTTFGTPNLWRLLTGDRCSKVALCYKTEIGTSKRWSVFGGGR